MQVDKLFVAMKAVIEHEGKILLLQESSAYQDGTNIGKYNLPGGRIDPSESCKDALLREIKEEAGLHVVIDRPLIVDEWWPQVRGEQWHIVATFLLCHAASDEVTLGPDHASYLWIDPKDRASVTNCAPNIQDVLQAYVDQTK